MLQIQNIEMYRMYLLERPKSKTRMDSRGNVEIQSYVVLAAGYSLKSGKLNIPLNIFVIPSKTSTRYGFSFGFNIRK